MDAYGRGLRKLACETALIDGWSVRTLQPIWSFMMIAMCASLRFRLSKISAIRSWPRKAIGWRPVITVPGEGSDLTSVGDDNRTIAVVLDLVNPAPRPWVVPARAWGFPA